MTELYNALYERWRLAFDEFSRLDEYKAAGRTIRYADNFRFRLADYDPAGFPAGGPLTTERDAHGTMEYQYHLDDAGLPVFVSITSSNKYVSNRWQGFYRYTPDMVEYIEFNLDTKYPSSIERVIRQHGKKTSYQRFSLNSRGTFNIPHDQLDYKALFTEIENYHYQAHRIISADGFAAGGGLAPWLYNLAYDYLDTGELDTIRIIYTNGQTRLTYVRPDPAQSLEQLSDRLARQLASLIIDTLIANQTQQPIALLALNYRTGKLWIPSLATISQADKKEILDHHKGKDVFQHLFISSGDEIDLDNSPIERLWVQFFGLVNSAEDAMPGENMLRKTARLLTLGGLDGKLAVDDEFIAYALDGEFEINDLEQILPECGLSEATLQKWREKKWFDN